MKRQARAKARTLLSGFSSRVGAEILNVRIYREGEAFVCERELVERDGTSFTMVLPFKEPDEVRTLLEGDPHYERVRREVARTLSMLDRALREHGRRAA